MRATTWPIGLLPYGIMARNTEKYRSTVEDPGLQIGGAGRGGGGGGGGAVSNKIFYGLLSLSLV